MGYSDHNMISGERIAKGGDNMPKYTQKRTYKNLNNNEYLKELEKKKWLDIYLEEEDVNRAVRIFTENMTSILNREDMAPVKTIQNRKNYCPWISEETKDLMRQRDEAVRKLNESRTPDNESEAKRLRKEVIDTLKEEKRENGRKKLEALEREKDTGKIWGCIKSYLNWNKQSGAPTMLVDKNGKPETSPKRLAELQNDFYITKVSKIREVLPKGGEPLKVLQGMMKERQRPDITQNLRFRAVLPEEIDKTS